MIHVFPQFEKVRGMQLNPKTKIQNPKEIQNPNSKSAWKKQPKIWGLGEIHTAILRTLMALGLAMLAAAGCAKKQPWNEPPLPSWPYFSEMEKRFADAAFSGVVDLAVRHNHEKTRERERILFIVGESYFHLGQNYRACLNYLDLLEEFPFSQVCDAVGQRLFAIAQEAHKEGLTKVRLPNTHRTVAVHKILESSLQASPYGPAAAPTRFLLGEIAVENAQYDKAAPIYEEIYVAQPHGPWAEEALWQSAAAYRQIYRGRDYDETPILKAEAALLEYIVRYPQGPHRSEVDAVLKEIAGLRTERLERRRRFYEKRGYDGAVRYYETLIQDAKR